jgi:hypothetical protein
MGGSISQLHRLRNRYLVNIYLGGKDLFDLEKEALSAKELSNYFGRESFAIFNNILSEFHFPNKTIQGDLVVSFLKSGRIPFESLPLAQEWEQTEAHFRVGEEETALSVVRSEDDLNKSKEDLKKSKEDVAIPTMWKKHEITINEKIIITTTVENGFRRILVESDRSQNEEIHIENESGDFAHREYSQQEQSEELDGELATFLRATEEFVHLKKDDDEYEFLHADIPDNDTKSDDDVNESDSTEEFIG